MLRLIQQFMPNHCLEWDGLGRLKAEEQLFTLTLYMTIKFLSLSEGSRLYRWSLARLGEVFWKIDLSFSS